MEESKNLIKGYSLCFNEWALDKEIKNEIRLLLIISSLCAKNGYCFASNKYFSEVFGETEVSISQKIKKLETKNYIEIEYKRRGCEVISRTIRLKNILTDDLKIFKPTIKKNFKENNISINNISINKKEIDNNKLLSTKKNEKNTVFQPPTLEEVIAYCEERGKGVDGRKVFDYYSANDWKDSKGSPIKNWKQKIIGVWEKDKTSVVKEQGQEDKSWIDEYGGIHI